MPEAQILWGSDRLAATVNHAGRKFTAVMPMAAGLWDALSPEAREDVKRSLVGKVAAGMVDDLLKMATYKVTRGATRDRPETEEVLTDG